MKQYSLIWKFTFAFMLVALTTTGLVALSIRITSQDRLVRLVIDQERTNLQTSLAEYYSTNSSWVGVSQIWQELHGQPFPPPPQNKDNPPPGNGDRRRLFGLADPQGMVIVEVDPHYPVGALVPEKTLAAGTAVMVNGQQVGTILEASRRPGLNPAETLFLRRTTEALFMAVVGALFVALVMGVVLARTLIQPLQALTDAAHKIADGQLDQQVQVKSKDEIGQLAIAFNRMSQEIARVNLQRRQMTADIAHDLRTPLTVIAGYVESIQDGVLEPTTTRMALIYTEIERLLKLVGDLRLLSQADAGELPLNSQLLAPKYLLERAATPFQHRAEQQEVTLGVETEDALPNVQVDEDRMMQVFDNLVANALRYTHAGGTITLKAGMEGEYVVLTVKDTGEGIDEEVLPYIFERFHRGDKSRHAEEGESGLGLAIVKALVESQGGSVVAESTSGQGTSIKIYLPV
jgi:signal transduction histidine kinase